MRFQSSLVPATLIRRYKRFLADVTMPDGAALTVHCPNPGSMMGLAAPGSRVFLSDSANPKRKLRYTWELVEADGALVGINTGLPNRLAEEAITAGAIGELAGYGSLRREVRYGKSSRIDLLLEDAARPPAYVEVKNVHLRRAGSLAEFPDCVTARGAKHLAELADVVAAGGRAVMLYVVQRPDCDRFALAGDIDRGYAAAFSRALSQGVEAIVYGCEVERDEIVLARRLPIV